MHYFAIIRLRVTLSLLGRSRSDLHILFTAYIIIGIFDMAGSLVMGRFFYWLSMLCLYNYFAA